MTSRAPMAGLAVWLGAASSVLAGELRFPPPDFESGYTMPVTQYPAARWQGWEYLDVVVLLVSLAVATWLVHGHRSRRGVVALSVFSLLYFGFLREGCICAIGSVQNVALALGNPAYALPVAVGVFFAAPVLVALFFGRTFCAAVCPHGALQDLVLVRPVRVPAWLESGLSIVPLVFLGAGVAFAATGAGFVICRYDPFVPIFRLGGGWGMVTTGIALLALGTVVGRPYCRFLCPYGALLRIASALSRWRLRVTPDVCTQCRLCPSACPFEAIEEPEPGLVRSKDVAPARSAIWRGLGWLPVWVVVGTVVGWGFGRGAASLHPTVHLALAAQSAGAGTSEPRAESVSRPDRLALARAEREMRELLPRAADLIRRMQIAGAGLGAWTGLVVGLKILGAGMVRRRSEFQPDRSACVACARCFASCPQERIRLGMTPSPEWLAEVEATRTAACGSLGSAGGAGSCAHAHSPAGPAVPILGTTSTHHPEKKGKAS